MSLKFKFRWPLIIIILVSIGLIWNINFYCKLIIIINFLILLLIVENKYEESNIKTKQIESFLWNSTIPLLSVN